jgi:hypothetical protein
MSSVRSAALPAEMRQMLSYPAAGCGKGNKRMTHPSMKLRCSGQAVVASFAAVLLALAPITAEAKPSSSPKTPLERRTYTAEGSKRLGDEAHHLAEVQQHIWDRKMKAVSSSICTGC